MNDNEKFKKDRNPPYPPEINDYYSGKEQTGKDPYNPDKKPNLNNPNASKLLDDALERLHKIWKNKRIQK